MLYFTIFFVFILNILCCTISIESKCHIPFWRLAFPSTNKRKC